MYPVRLGFEEAVRRIKALQKNGHHAEALLTTVFTVEKTLRRTLRQLVVSSGFQSSIASKVMENIRGLDAIKRHWEIYDPRHRSLTVLLANRDWKRFKDASEMRNDLVHGKRVYGTKICNATTNDLLQSLKATRKLLDAEYGYSGWTIGKIRRASTLHSKPTVTWTR